MGINDRDYMRRPEQEPQASPRTVSPCGLLVAVVIVGGVIFLRHHFRENRAKRNTHDIYDEVPLVIRIPEPSLGPPPPSLRRPVNVNTATFAELDSLPQIGEEIDVDSLVGK